MAKLRGLSQLDGVAQAALGARDDLTASELLEAFAERLEALNPLLRAVPVVDVERARGEGTARSAEPVNAK